jgi:hypothetical protein
MCLCRPGCIFVFQISVWHFSFVVCERVCVCVCVCVCVEAPDGISRNLRVIWPCYDNAGKRHPCCCGTGLDIQMRTWGSIPGLGVSFLGPSGCVCVCVCVMVLCVCEVEKHADELRALPGLEWGARRGVKVFSRRVLHWMDKRLVIVVVVFILLVILWI